MAVRTSRKKPGPGGRERPPPRPPDDAELDPIRREAMDFAHIGMFRFLFDGTVVFMDRCTLRIFDLLDDFPDPAMVTGRNISTLFRYHAKSTSLRETVRQQKIVRSFEYHLRTLKGDDRWLLHNSYLVTDPGTGEEAIQVIVVDITEQKRMERALAQSERRAAAILRALPDRMFRFSRDGEFLEYFAPVPADLYIAPDRIVGGNLRSLLPEIAEEATETVRRSLDSGETQTLEYALPYPDGERFFEARCVPCGENEALAIVRDVTEQRHNHEERVRLVEQMQRAQRLESLGVLAGGIAHDFNNLLTGVLASAGMLEESIRPDSRDRDALSRVVTGVQRAAELTRELLAYSGRGRLVVEPLDLVRLVHEMAQLLETAVSKKAAFVLDLEPEPVVVEGDATQLRQVVMNLITNASDALEGGSGAIEVRLRRRELAENEARELASDWDVTPGLYATFEVEDDGCGMDEETASRIFEPFFTTKFTGRGLGLAATQGIIRGHGGAIRLRTAPGRGTTATVLLPLTERALPAPPPPKDERPPLPPSAVVLVVDDEESIRQVAEIALRRAGLEVDAVADGHEAVEAVKRAPERYSAVLLDMTMPRMSGPETFRALREIRPDLPIVLSSGYAEEDTVRRFRGEDLAGFLQKPYRPQALVDGMTRALTVARQAPPEERDP